MAPTFNKFQQFVADVAHKVHNLGTSGDTLKVMLTNTLPINTNVVQTDITEITAQNGYTAGGSATTITASSQSGGTFKLVCSNVVFTASGGSFGPFRYVVLYNDTPTSPEDPLIGWYDYGSSISTNDTETFGVNFDQTSGVLTLA